MKFIYEFYLHLRPPPPAPLPPPPPPPPPPYTRAHTTHIHTRAHTHRIVWGAYFITKKQYSLVFSRRKFREEQYFTLFR